MTRKELVTRWTARREEWHRFQMETAASICDELLADLQQLWADEEAAVVVLKEAARISGFSQDHLRRLVREGKLPASKQGRRLCFQVGDLPRKPPHVDVLRCGEYDPRADARQVAAVRSRGGER